MKDVNREIEGIAQWIRQITENAGVRGVVVGLSGGIDSSVTAALCVRALGLERVTALIMPCLSIAADREDAELVANSLGLRAIVWPLDEAYTALLSGAEKVMDKKFSRLTMANAKARLRMTALYLAANEGNCLVAGTSNKSELMVGYCTKYGDGGVDFEPIGEYYKFEVRELARALGIPERIIERAPSAGLWEGQTDEEELGMSYDTVDLALQHMETARSLEQLPEGLDSSVLMRVLELYGASRHKCEMPPTYQRKR